jgi:hypothetical protein
MKLTIYYYMPMIRRERFPRGDLRHGWMMLDLVLALRQVVFLAWVIFREHKWVILR